MRFQRGRNREIGTQDVTKINARDLKLKLGITISSPTHSHIFESRTLMLENARYVMLTLFSFGYHCHHLLFLFCIDGIFSVIHSFFCETLCSSTDLVRMVICTHTCIVIKFYLLRDSVMHILPPLQC